MKQNLNYLLTQILVNQKTELNQGELLKKLQQKTVTKPTFTKKWNKRCFPVQSNLTKRYFQLKINVIYYKALENIQNNI